VREIGRNAQGVRLIDMADTDRVVGVAKLAETSGEGAGEGENHDRVPDPKSNGG
jgi:DNA gyrase/topoisomerase IV subunit A